MHALVLYSIERFDLNPQSVLPEIEHALNIREPVRDAVLTVALHDVPRQQHELRFSVADAIATTKVKRELLERRLQRIRRMELARLDQRAHFCHVKDLATKTQ